jgi:MFS family permease
MRLTPAEIRAVVALAVGMFCVQVDFFALNLALPRMAVDLNQTTTNMQWVISAYMIAVGAAMIPGGRLGDLRGPAGSSWPAWLSSAGRHWSVACPPRTAC